MNQHFRRDSVVVFYGDSITESGRSKSDTMDLGNGYPKKVAQIYRSLFPDSGVVFANRGIYGATIGDLNDGYFHQIKPWHPDFISILAGVNDTWNLWLGGEAVDLRSYENCFCELIEKIRMDFPKSEILVMKPFLLDTDPEKVPWHQDFDPKAEAVEKLARECADYFLDLPELFAQAKREGVSNRELSADGVHPTDYAHGMIAVAYLRTLGVL